MTPTERIEHVRHWLELKQAWERWKDGLPMPPMTEAARLYFERRAGQAVRKYAERYPMRFLHTAPPSSDRECWGILMEYLLRKRPKARLHLIDHIFESAFQAAAASLGGRLEGETGLEHAVEWLLNRFNTQVVLSAMGDYLRQNCQPAKGTVIQSMDAPAGGSGIPLGESHRMDQPERWWETELERDEVEKLARAAAEGYFHQKVRPAFRLGVFLRGLRQYRGVTISCAERCVLAVAGVGRAVFAEGTVKAFNGLTAVLRENEALEELDGPPRRHADCAAADAMTDAAETWFFSGAWITDCCREQSREPGGAPKPDAAEVRASFPARAETLALLVRERLRESGKILAENEMVPVFLLLEAFSPACC